MTPRVDALTAQWVDDGATRGAAYIELRDLAREIERQNAELAADALNTMLWLYRRLPRGYGRPPAVERSINALAAKTGIDVAAFLSERDDTAAPHQQSEKEGGS